MPYKAVGYLGDKILVEFTFDAPSAKQVHLAGSFNYWAISPMIGEDKILLPIPMKIDQETGYWTVIIPLSPGRWPYKYIVDKMNWKHDPLTAYIWD